MIVNREALIKAVEILAMIPQRAGIPPSEYIKIEPKKDKLNLYLSSDALGRIEVAKDGDWPVSRPYFVDRSLFVPFIMAAKNMNSAKDFEFEDSGSQVLMVKHARRRITLAPLPLVTGYGKIEAEPDAIELKLTQKQKELIRCAAPCATSDPISPQLNCVYMSEEGLVMASNQIVIFSAQTKKFAKSIPMPLYLLSLLALDEAQTLVFSSKQVVMKLSCGEILQTVTQQALKGFPAKKITEWFSESDSYKTVMSVEAEKLNEVLGRFSTYLTSVRRQDKVISLSTISGKSDLKITAQIAAVKFQDSIRMNASASFDFKAEWALEMVEPVIQFLAQKKANLVIRYKKKSPYFIDGGDIKLLLARKVT